MNYIHKLYKSLINGNERSILVKKNILLSFLIKGWGCLVQFLLVPITLKCLNQYEYGIWLTINSILIWIDTFDIGLGNGLRNNLATSIAKGNIEKARIQISTTFILLAIIVIPLILLVFCLIELIDVYKILNVSQFTVPDLKNILIISFALVGTTFIFKIIGNVFMGLQQIAISNSLIVIGQTVSLIGIFILTKTESPKLVSVAFIYTFSPLLVYLVSYPITFTKYYYLRPSLKKFRANEINGLFTMGVKFFLAQISGLVIFTSSNLLISHLFSPSVVTPFQIANRYFGLTNIAFTIISAPFWTATTDAYSKNDWQWIKNSEKKMRNVILLFIICITIMLIVAKPFFHIWVGLSISIPTHLTVLLALYMVTIIYSTCYSNFICGIGKIKVLTISTILEAVIYIPLAIWFGKLFGVSGIVVSLILVTLTSAILNKAQFSLLSKGIAKGIWNE